MNTENKTTENKTFVVIENCDSFDNCNQGRGGGYRYEAE